MTCIDLQNFVDFFIKKCDEKKETNFDSILQYIKASYSLASGGFRLDLSNICISSKLCSILASLFKTDHCFSEIYLNDCSISNDGIRAICYGLSENIGCKKLFLKGNSVRGTAVEAVGRLIRLNSKLKNLCLEWNNFGIVMNSFDIFCEGIGGNHTLIYLDLRSNQLNHLNAIALAEALKMNSTLRCIDLRWNEIGLLGGRALLKMLETNKTIIKLLITGNNIPDDVAKYIEMMVSRNADNINMDKQYKSRQAILCNEIKDLKITEKRRKKKELDENDLFIQRNSAQKIYLLKNALDERKQNFLSLNSKLSLTETELVLVESRLLDLNKELNDAKNEFMVTTKNYQAEIAREKEEKFRIEANLSKENTKLVEQNCLLQAKIDDLEQKLRIKNDKIFSLKETNARLNSDFKLKQSQHDDMLEYEKQKFNSQITDLETKKNKELANSKSEYSEAEYQLKEKLSQNERLYQDLENTIQNLKKQIFNDKLLNDEQIKNVKLIVRAEEENVRRNLEDRLRLAEGARDSVNSLNNQQLNQINDLQYQNAKLSKDIDSFRKRISDLQHDVTLRDTEYEETLKRLNQDSSQKLNKLEMELNTKNQFILQINTLEKTLTDMNKQQNNNTSGLEKELNELRKMLQQIKDTDEKRCNVMKDAVNKYVQIN